MPPRDPLIDLALGGVFRFAPGAQWARYAAPDALLDPAAPAFRVIVATGDVEAQPQGLLATMVQRATMIEIRRADLAQPRTGGLIQTYQTAAGGGVGAADELWRIAQPPMCLDPARAVWTCQVITPDPGDE